MLRLLAFFLWLALPLCSFAQDETTLTGALEMATGESFPYKLVFTEKEGKISGYSITYKEPNDTKSLITGSMDRENRTLIFRETNIVYSSGFHTRAFMCLVNARLDYVQGGMGNILRGPLTGKEADKTLCTSGSLTFSEGSQLKKLFTYPSQFDTVISFGKKKKAPVAIQPASAPKNEAAVHTEQITTGIVKTYDWHTDTVIIDIWDGGTVDGDHIALQYNNSTVLSDYFLVKQKKRLKIPVSAHGTDLITITALTEGSEPPNTANLLLTDGEVHYSILAYNKKGDKAIIKIRRVHP